MIGDIFQFNLTGHLAGTPSVARLEGGGYAAYAVVAYQPPTFGDDDIFDRREKQLFFIAAVGEPAAALLDASAGERVAVQAAPGLAGRIIRGDARRLLTAAQIVRLPESGEDAFSCSFTATLTAAPLHWANRGETPVTLLKARITAESLMGSPGHTYIDVACYGERAGFARHLPDGARISVDTTPGVGTKIYKNKVQLRVNARRISECLTGHLPAGDLIQTGDGEVMSAARYYARHPRPVHA